MTAHKTVTGLCLPPGKLIHGSNQPSDLPEDCQYHPPVPCDLAVGDEVTYTNDYGVKFDLVVRGFAKEPRLNGRFIYVFTDAWWMPVTRESLTAR